MREDFEAMPVRLRVCVRERERPGSDAEVGELDVATIIKHDVGRLDVAVDAAHRVEIVEARERAAADLGNEGLRDGQVTRFHQVAHRPRVAELPGPRPSHSQCR